MDVTNAEQARIAEEAGVRLCHYLMLILFSECSKNAHNRWFVANPRAYPVDISLSALLWKTCYYACQLSN